MWLLIPKPVSRRPVRMWYGSWPPASDCRRCWRCCPPCRCPPLTPPAPPPAPLPPRCLCLTGGEGVDDGVDDCDDSDDCDGDADDCDDSDGWDAATKLTRFVLADFLLLCTNMPLAAVGAGGRTCGSGGGTRFGLTAGTGLGHPLPDDDADSSSLSDVMSTVNAGGGSLLKHVGGTRSEDANRPEFGWASRERTTPTIAVGSRTLSNRRTRRSVVHCMDGHRCGPNCSRSLFVGSQKAFGQTTFHEHVNSLTPPVFGDKNVKSKIDNGWRV